MSLFEDLRRAAAGAIVGARLAVGAERLAALRATWRVLSIFGWLGLGAWVAIVLLVVLGGV